MDMIKTGEFELRRIFADTLQQLMERNKNVVYLEADLGGAIGTTQLFRQYPQQAFDIGIMEANMIGAASGMSVKGKIPFVHSFGTFASRRCADQTFLSGCYNRANVKIIGSDPGIAAESNGGTHMPLEDMAIYRAFPQMQVIDVADPFLLRFILEQAASHYGMQYIRFPRKGKLCYYSSQTEFVPGQAKILLSGSDVSIFACGLGVYEALKAAQLLAAEGIFAEVVDVFTVKPLDVETILKSVHKTCCAVTVENHNIIGGLGSAVAEALVEHFPVPMRRIGAPDCFGEVGTQEFLRKKMHMDSTDVAAAAHDALSCKQN